MTEETEERVENVLQDLFWKLVELRVGSSLVGLGQSHGLGQGHGPRQSHGHGQLDMVMVKKRQNSLF